MKFTIGAGVVLGTLGFLLGVFLDEAFRPKPTTPSECAQLLNLAKDSADTLYVVVTVRECLATVKP